MFIYITMHNGICSANFRGYMKRSFGALGDEWKSGRGGIRYYPFSIEFNNYWPPV